MESILNYYYGLVCDEIKKKDNYYLIKSSNDTYVFCELIGSIDEVLKIIDILNKTDIKYHLLVITKENNLYVTFEGKNYCLFKVRCNLNEKINLFLFNKIKEQGNCNWSDVWGKRIDYYESQVEELIKEPSIKYALQYYIGLTEIAIYYANVLKEKYENNLTFCLSHKKIDAPLNQLMFYNPLNLLIDVEVRDLAEYFKAAYFNEVLTDYELLSLIDKMKFDEQMANYLFLRLLYPSYFFYLYDDYIENRTIDDKIFLYIKKSKDYESLLSKVYSRLSINNNLFIKLWFIKAQHL